MKVVISQSMYFPWVGFLEQLRLADVYVRYDDVQFSKGSFTNRVQIKTANGLRWLTVPLNGLHLGQHINEVLVNGSCDWRRLHRDMLVQSYRKAPYVSDMLGLVDAVFSQPFSTLSQVAYFSTMVLADYFGLTAHLRLLDSADLGIAGSGSKRVLEIVRSLGGTVYITGHGARNYLNHVEFEQAGIAVHYMQYLREPYPQQYGEFIPYVSALDLIANCGHEGVRYIQSTTVDWKEFVSEPA